MPRMEEVMESLMREYGLRPTHAMRAAGFILDALERQSGGTRTVEDCTVVIQGERGVIYVSTKGGGFMRISGLTPEQCMGDHIDVRAEQPRSHNETLYGWPSDEPVPEHLMKKRSE